MAARKSITETIRLRKGPDPGDRTPGTAGADSRVCSRNWFPPRLERL
jgi:hypothetical protein